MRVRRWNALIGLLKHRDHGVGAEIGVFEGDTSVRLMEHLPGIGMLFCIDPFEHYPDQTNTLKPNKPKFHDANYEHVQKTFRRRMFPYADRYTLLKKYSVEAAKDIEDHSLDFVFIDGNHAYDYVVADIKAWLPKIKPGGILTGHDYLVKGYKNRFGVTQAVRELFKGNHGNIGHVWFYEVGT